MKITLSDFMSEANAYHKKGDGFNWVVEYNKVRYYIEADSEYDAKENAFIYLMQNGNKEKNSNDSNEAV